MPPQSKKTFEYTLTTYQGVRAEDWSQAVQPAVTERDLTLKATWL